MHDLLDDYEKQAASLSPSLALSQQDLDILREGRRLVMCRNKEVESFMVALSAAPVIRLEGESGGEEGSEQALRVVRLYLEMVEEGLFSREDGKT